jgi:hypothetical protein
MFSVALPAAEQAQAVQRATFFFQARFEKVKKDKAHQVVSTATGIEVASGVGDGQKLALLLMRQGNFDDAAAVLETILAWSPYNDRTITYLALCEEARMVPEYKTELILQRKFNLFPLNVGCKSRGCEDVFYSQGRGFGGFHPHNKEYTTLVTRIMAQLYAFSDFNGFLGRQEYAYMRTLSQSMCDGSSLRAVGCVGRNPYDAVVKFLKGLCLSLITSHTHTP